MEGCEACRVPIQPRSRPSFLMETKTPALWAYISLGSFSGRLMMLPVRM